MTSTVWAAPGGALASAERTRTYTSVATKDGGHWLVRCDQRPEVTTTAKRLDHAVAEHRRALAESVDAPDGHVDVAVRPVIPARAQEHLDRARELRQTAAFAKAEAAAEARSAARGLVAMEITLRDIGKILGVSHQRAHQLVTDRSG